MSGKVGRNSLSYANDIRPFICEVCAGDDPLIVTPATLFADFAAATFPLSNQPVDPSYARICQIEISLAGLGDETADGKVSTSCQAVVTDTETEKAKDLEPGGNFLYEVGMTAAVPDFEVEIAPGSVVIICGMFCTQVNAKTLGVGLVGAIGVPGMPGEPGPPGEVDLTCVSTETTSVLCDDDDDGIVNIQISDKKTGEVVKNNRLGAAMCSAYTSGNAFGATFDAPSDEPVAVIGNDLDFEIPCDQDVMFDFYYDLIVVNTNPGVEPSNAGANLYSYLDINGASGAGLPDQWFTLSDAPYNQANGDPDAELFGEQNVSGSACVFLTAGQYTVRGVADIWRPRNSGLIYRFSNMKLVANWVKLVCKQ